MHQQRPTRIESDNQILATAPDLGHALTDELAGDDLGVERPHQPRIANLDVLESRPLEHGRDRTPHGLDLGELRHTASLGTEPCPALARVCSRAGRLPSRLLLERVRLESDVRSWADRLGAGCGWHRMPGDAARDGSAAAGSARSTLRVS